MLRSKEVSMTKRIMLLGLVALAAVACDTIEGSGFLTRQERSLEPFESVEVRAGLEVDVGVGPQRVVVEGDDNIVPHVVTTVRHGVLLIAPRHDFDPVVPLHVAVTVPRLDTATSVSGSHVSVTVVEAATLSLRVLSGSELVADGQVEALEAKLDGGGFLDAESLAAGHVSLWASAGGEAWVTAEDSVEGLVKSGSVGRVFGAPPQRSVSTASGGVVVFE
jgi:hypothetical protein